LDNKWIKVKPKTIYEAADALYNSLEPDDYNFIVANGTIGLHHGLGTQIRNEWGLWHNSDLAIEIKNLYGLGHADDMSGLILEALRQRCAGEPIELDDDAAKYKQHWISYNIDPLTQEEII
jgi:hypothetical protein